MPPTLLIKGKLVAPTGIDSMQQELDTWVPVEYIVEWFRTRLQKIGVENRVLVLKSQTASGKSTALPPILYRALVPQLSTETPGLICTQPRVLTAIENIRVIMKYNADFLHQGINVGWSTKYNKLKPKNYGLLSATIGTLTQVLKTCTDDEICRKYRFILIDETHERNLQTDMTLAMLKNLVFRNAGKVECPFVVMMSATFEPDSFLKFFGIEKLTNFIWCVGASHPIDEKWDWVEKRQVLNYAQAAADVVEGIMTDYEKYLNPKVKQGTDILIFMPGAKEIAETAKCVEKVNAKNLAARLPVSSICKLDSDAIGTNNDDYRRALYIPIAEQRVKINNEFHPCVNRVIISTVVAETGLSLDDLKFVIDAGFNKEIEFNPVFGITGLITKFAPQSRITQRRGRVGRYYSGYFYPLYTKDTFSNLQTLQFPEILTQDVLEIMLDIIAEQLRAKAISGIKDPEFKIQDIDMLDVPSGDAIGYAMAKLYNLGYISGYGQPWREPEKDVLLTDSVASWPTVEADINKEPRITITKLGYLARGIMLPPEASRMVLASWQWGVAPADVISMAVFATMELSKMVEKSDDGEKLQPPWELIYRTGVPAYIDGNAVYTKMRLMIGDDFIQGIIFHNALLRVAVKTENATAYKNLTKWCETNKLRISFINSFIDKRDEIIDGLLQAGFAVFNGTPSLSEIEQPDFVDYIARLKHCIYDGYKSNLLVFDGKEYTTCNGLAVKKPNIVGEDNSKGKKAPQLMPKFIIYEKLGLKESRKVEGIYEVKGATFSVMDGFVSVDPSFAI